MAVESPGDLSASGLRRNSSRLDRADRSCHHALTADQWYTDFGRFGTALRSTWCGAVLSAGLLLLAIALALLVFEVLLSKRD
ncbi:MAG: hypothetical protein ACLTYN_04390 [Dysosmobacter welbionis]